MYFLVKKPFKLFVGIYIKDDFINFIFHKKRLHIVNIKYITIHFYYLNSQSMTIYELAPREYKLKITMILSNRNCIVKMHLIIKGKSELQTYMLQQKIELFYYWYINISLSTVIWQK